MFKGFRTLVFNIIMGAMMFVKQISPETEVPAPEAVGTTLDTIELVFTAIWFGGNVFLRFVTDSPIFNREKK